MKNSIFIFYKQVALIGQKQINPPFYKATYAELDIIKTKILDT
jgi:hypothetical protein